MARIPTWVKFAVPIGVFLVLLAAAVIRVSTERLPDNAQQAIAVRFDTQLEELRRIAVDMPVNPCAETDLPTMHDRIEDIRAWSNRVEDSRQVFDDPVILDAEIVSSCGENRVSYSVKSFDSGTPMWRPSVRAPTAERPAVTLWYAGFRRLALYEDRIAELPSGVTQLRLLLDLEGLEL